jgi:hypothetical protein
MHANELIVQATGIGNAVKRGLLITFHLST